MNGAGNGHPRERLSDYLDDQLGVEDRASMDRHLAECEDCRVELDALRRLVRAVADERTPPVPVDLAARIGRTLDAATGVRPHRRRFVVPATIAATIMAIGILVTLQWREGRLELPPVPEPVDELKRPLERPRQGAPRPLVEPEAVPAVPKETKQEAPAREMKDEDLRRKDETPTAGRFYQKVDKGVASGVEGGVPGGVVGGVVGGVAGADEKAAATDSAAMRLAPAAPLAKTSAVSPCVDRWSDSGVRAIWGVPDIDNAATELGVIADAVGGIGLWRGIDDGRPYVIVVPRERFEEVFDALRARGASGLDAPPALDPGTDCKGISVALIAVAPTPAEAPR